MVDEPVPGLPRSYLFVPGNRPDRFDKAWASGADAVIIDLEDAVPPNDKDAARAAVARWLSAARPVVVRVNACDTPWFAADLAACREAGVAAIMLPKAEQPDQLVAIGARVPLIPLIETAAGLDRVRHLAAVEGVQRLAFGAIDFQLDLNLRARHDELDVFRAPLVLASRLAGVGTPIDGPSTAIDAAAELEAEAARGRRLGFGAKLCIHPRQVAVVNRSFSPSPDEVAWAQRVIAAAAASDGAAVALDGKMIDRPVILRAHAILAERRADAAGR